MCVISDSENLIFLHAPKCGGMSFITNNNKIWNNPQGTNHVHLSYIKTRNYFSSISKIDFFNNANIYARVREPLPRMKSLYSFVLVRPDHPLNIDTKNGFESFVNRVCSSEKLIFGPCYRFLMNEKRVIDPRIKIERLEDVKGETIHNTSKSNEVDVTSTAEEMIREHFKKDYELWY